MNGTHGDTIFRTPERMATGVSLSEAIVGLAALALAIIGLAHLFPWLLASISTVVLGAAFVFEAGAIGARFTALSQEAQIPRETSVQEAGMPISRETSVSRVNVWGGVAGITASGIFGFMAGCTGIALGILAILNISREILVPIAVIVYGAALLMDSGMRERLSNLENEKYYAAEGMAREVAKEAAVALSSIEVLVGLGGITLGILAVIGIASQVLSLVGLLSIGAATLVLSSLPAGKMMARYKVR